MSGPGDSCRPIGSCGRALPNGQIVFGEDEELCWKGANNFVGYTGLAEDTAETLDGSGLLHTGDLGTVDANGYVFITGTVLVHSQPFVPQSSSGYSQPHDPSLHTQQLTLLDMQGVRRTLS